MSETAAEIIRKRFGAYGAVRSHAISENEAENLIREGLAYRASIREDGRNRVRTYTDYFVVLTPKGAELADSQTSPHPLT